MKMKKKMNDDFIDPLSFFELESEQKEGRRPGGEKSAKEKQAQAKQGRAVFISGTDTGVGKTTATYVLGTLLKSRGLDIGVMKPVQCGGEDAQFLKQSLQVKDPLDEINPYRAKEPVSPHIAFKREKITVDPNQIINTCQKLKKKHDLLLIEGAGGLLAPIQDHYSVADLIRDLEIELIIVARLGLGTINHTLLTINQARDMGITVKGIIFNEDKKGKAGVPEKTNPQTVGRLGQVPVLGIIPYLSAKNAGEILRTCKRRINLRPLLMPDMYPERDAKQMAHWDKKYIWHPFTQMQDWVKEDPLVIDEGKGCFLRDVYGRRYLDGVSSLWVNVHGHRKEKIDKAIKAQMNKLSHSTLLGLSNVPAVKLAKKLVDVTPPGLEKVFYSDNGSTSVEVAIKMAYQYWQNTGKKTKTQIAHLANSYHGDTLGSVSVGGIDLFHKVYSRLIFKTLQVHFPDGYRAPRGKKYPDYTFEHLEKMEKLFKTTHDKIAALVIEPIVQGAGGMIVWPEGVLKKIDDICKKYDILLIADEVATGFGRTGKLFACEHEKVTPDFLCLAKGITGGSLPLAATLTTKRVYDGFVFDYKEQKAFFHGHTYGGNPLGCAAALANLQIFEKEQTLRKLQPKIKLLSEKLRNFYPLPHVGQVRQKGFMVGIELVKNKRTQTPYFWKEKIGIKVCGEVRKRGVILRPLGNVIVLMPPLVIPDKDLQNLLDITYWAIQKVTGR